MYYRPGTGKYEDDCQIQEMERKIMSIPQLWVLFIKPVDVVALYNWN